MIKSITNYVDYSLRFKAWKEWWLTPANNSAKHERLAITICLSGLVIIIFMVTLTQVGIFYDEEAHLSSLALLRETGLTHQFLRYLPVSTGPLLPVIQLVTIPVTKGSLIGLRLLNLPLIVGSVIFLWLILRHQNTHHAWSSAASLLTIPFMWLVSGVIFTEAPTIFCLSVASCLVTIALVEESRFTESQRLLLVIGAGIFSGLAFAGRQTALPIIAAVPLLLLRFRTSQAVITRNRLLPLIVFLVTSVVIPIWLIIVWQGITPPSHVFINEGLRLEHGVLNFAFAAILIMLLAPRILRMPFIVWVSLIGGSIITNATIFKIDIWFFTRAAKMVLPESLIPAYKFGSTGILLGIGIGCLSTLIKTAWSRRHDPVAIFATAATIMILAEAAKITFAFTYRYTVTASPFIILLTAKEVVPNHFRIARLIFAQILGALLLFDLLF